MGFQTYCQAYSSPVEQFSRWPSGGPCHPTARLPGQARTNPKDVPDICYTAIRTGPSDSSTRSRRAPPAQTRGSEKWSSPRRGCPPRQARAGAPRAARGSPQRWRAARGGEGEGRTPPVGLGVGARERRSARASTRRTSALGGHDAWLATLLREALRPSERGVRTCVITGAAARQ
jgi:hypothetical protein